MRWMKSLSGLALVALMCLGVPSAATAGGTATVAPIKMAPDGDDALANKVAKQLRQYSHYSVYDDVGGRVQDGTVTLTGVVTAPFKATDLAKIVARIPGVVRVDNRIRALPLSPNDDRLRVAIATRIYRDPLFTPYAMQANPPIHIIVENGQVTLTGVVNTDLERRQAGLIAQGVPGAFSVKNTLKLDSEVQSIR
jgi:osmotically-inducible protein OsmY